MRGSDTVRFETKMTSAASIRTATIAVTIRGRGQPVVRIPSRGRGSEDVDDLSQRLVDASFQDTSPQPRGIVGSTDPMGSITYHDLAAAPENKTAMTTEPNDRGVELIW